MPSFVFLGVEGSDVFVAGVEVHAAERFAIVVVEEDAAVAFGVAHEDSFRGDGFAQDRFDDEEPFKFFVRCNDTGFAAGFVGFGRNVLGADVCRCVVVGRHCALEADVDYVVDVMLDGGFDLGAEVFDDVGPERAGEDLGSEKADKCVGGVIELLRDEAFDLARILEVLRRGEGGFDVEAIVCQFFDFGDERFFHRAEIKDHERAFVHHVGAVKIGEKFVDNAIRQDADAGCGGVLEVSVQLVGSARVQCVSAGFALNEKDGVTVAFYRVIDLLIFLGARIRSVFRDDDTWVKGVVPKGLQERHDKGRFGCLLGGDVGLEFLYSGGQFLNALDEIHNLLLQVRGVFASSVLRF